jgi:prophage regulatory protein
MTHQEHSIIRLPTVVDKTGLSRSSIYKRMHSGDFPKSLSLGSRSVGWYAADVDKWIEQKVTASKTRSC